ncbi:hypothetical protein [Candidatus Ichthyocystis sparus]|nr:hypothetical protein [Candidatus Ichthyocystis sparus]
MTSNISHTASQITLKNDRIGGFIYKSTLLDVLLMLDMSKVKEKLCSELCEAGESVKNIMCALVANRLSRSGLVSRDTFNAQSNFLDEIEDRIGLVEEKLAKIESLIDGSGSADCRN